MLIFICPKCKKDFMFIGISMLCDECNDEIERELALMKKDLKERRRMMKLRVIKRKRERESKEKT